MNTTDSFAGLRPPGAPSIWTEYMRLDEMLAANRNPKTHDLPSIVAALVRYGAVGALAQLDMRTGTMVGGHGRVEALAWMKSHPGDYDLPLGCGIDEDGEWMLPVECGWASRDDLEADAVIVALNQTSTSGGWHMVSLAEVLEDIVTADAGLMETLGFGYEDIDNIIARVDPGMITGATIAPPIKTDDLDDLDPTVRTRSTTDDDVTYERPGKTHTCPGCGLDFKD